MMKDSLETQKQTNFNAVFNKIKKDKDAQIRDMAAKISTLEKELQQARNRTTALNSEIGVHKEAYSTIQNDFEKAKDECIALQNDLEKSKNAIKDLEDQILNLNELKTQSEKDFDRRIDMLNEEKLKVIQELKTQYDEELAKEKATLISAAIHPSTGTVYAKYHNKIDFSKTNKKLHSIYVIIMVYLNFQTYIICIENSC